VETHDAWLSGEGGKDLKRVSVDVSIDTRLCSPEHDAWIVGNELFVSIVALYLNRKLWPLMDLTRGLVTYPLASICGWNCT
jgi:hypothetical protein